jgi:uncharacterized protein YggE
MSRTILSCAIALATASLPLASAYGQMSGTAPSAALRVLDGGTPSPLSILPLLEPEVAEGYITIDGVAELRAQPTEIRVVLAVTAEGETAQKCRQAVDATIANLKAAWSKAEISPENVVVDFIAVVPRYSWSGENYEVGKVLVEKKIGYRMQTNVHLAVQNDAQAQAAINRAFEQGVTDIIAFDYWTKDLDELKAKARQQAITAARAKAEVLLAVFPERPPVINVQEKTTVHYPDSLYHTFSIREEDSVYGGWNTNVPMIRAARPRQSYYRGLFSDGDIQPRDLPMKPEISVVSAVRLYYKSPANEGTKKEKTAGDKTKKDAVP